MRLILPKYKPISIKEVIIALLSGISACAYSYLLWILSTISVLNPVVALLNYAWYDNLLLSLSINSLIEETVKLLFLKKLKIFSGVLFGLSYGMTEIIIRGDPMELGYGLSAILHILTASIIVFSIKKNKVWLGFVIAFLIHTLWNYGITSISG